jgi:hypothetical protein
MGLQAPTYLPDLGKRTELTPKHDDQAMVDLAIGLRRDSSSHLSLISSAAPLRVTSSYASCDSQALRPLVERDLREPAITDLPQSLPLYPRELSVAATTWPESTAKVAP